MVEAGASIITLTLALDNEGVGDSFIMQYRRVDSFGDFLSPVHIAEDDLDEDHNYLIRNLEPGTMYEVRIAVIDTSADVPTPGPFRTG